jgi:hypothetical protein
MKKLVDTTPVKTVIIHPAFDRPISLEEAIAMQKLSQDPKYIEAEINRAFEERSKRLEEEAKPKDEEAIKAKRLAALQRAREVSKAKKEVELHLQQI